MRRTFVPLTALAACLAWTGTAHASGDFTCTPTWTLAHAQYAGCDNLDLLTPGNDTRVNLMLLWSDQRPQGAGPPIEGDSQGPMFDWDALAPKPTQADDSDLDSGEGSRCRTNTDGLAVFTKEIAEGADAPPEPERALLIAARKGMPATCPADGPDQAAFDDGGDKIHTASGRAFQTYLHGAHAFYGGDYDEATTRFAALAKVHSPWLRETGLYMLARVEVNRMQVGVFGDFGDVKQPASPAAVARTIAALDAYLKAYPDGAYAASARGLKRRAWWLGGMTAKLASEFAAVAAQDPARRGLNDASLAEEMDYKLLDQFKAADAADPTLLAVVDLRDMRKPDQGSAPLNLADLQSQRPRFAGREALFDYLLAVHAYYVDNQPAEVLRLIPAAAPKEGLSDVEFSRQVLHGMAMEAVRDTGARDYWLRMLPTTASPVRHATIELALAMHDERAGLLNQTFAPGSPVKIAAIRDILLSHSAGAALLRRQAGASDASTREREIAIFTLLYMELTRGRYADYLKDAPLIPTGDRTQPKDSDVSSFSYAESHDQWDQPTPLWTFVQPAGDAYACPALAETAAHLAGGGDARARMCLAEWVRTYGYDGFYLDTPPGKDELGGAAAPFPGPAYSRLETYKVVIADPKAGEEDKAYALYRAVNCYGPSGNNHCGGVEATPAERKAWFHRLKAEFAASPWSQKQKYFW